MIWNPTETEVVTLAAAPSDTRYDYFLHKVAGGKQIWSLRDAGGWRVVADASGRECVPVWPHQSFAELCATEEFAGSLPEPIPLDVFMSRWLPGMARDNRFAAVFPTPANNGVVVDPLELLTELETEACQP